MSRSLRTAAALILISCGGFLVYRGVHEYMDYRESQRQAAREWAKKARPKQWFIPQGEVFSRIEIPKAGTQLYVVEGSDENSLKKGPGHLRGSAMPGTTGNCVIAGHRDVHFRALKDISPGDEIFLETSQGRFTYRVTGTKIISPKQIEVLQPTSDAELHLITCYPFYFLGHAPKRFVVTAELASASVEQLAAVRTPLTPMQVKRSMRSRSTVAARRILSRQPVSAPSGL